MDILIKNVKILDPRSPFNEKTHDILIQQGKFTEIKKDIKPSSRTKIVEYPKAFLSPGWIDVGTHSGEPGYEQRETLKTLSQCALRGGYTSLCIFPNTIPHLHSKTEIEFIKNRSETLPISIFPIGAVSKECAGKEMAEFKSMYDAGAIAFSDGDRIVTHSGLLMRALEYNRMNPNIVILHHPFDATIAPAGQMHEGYTSSQMGLRGIPEIAETVMLHRDLELLKYTQSRYLAHKISTLESASLIRKHKQKQENLFSSVSVFNLVFQDDALSSFNQNLKVMPPLRSSSDRKALIKALQDATIDIICSDHHPLEPELKEIEFQKSAFGAINLETAYSLTQTFIQEELDPSLWVEKVAINPREIFSLSIDKIDIGSDADFTIFDSHSEWVYDHSFSLSTNSPLLGKKMRGKVIGSFKKSKLNLNE